MINLDKSICYSYDIIKGEKPTPNFVNVNKWFGLMHDFNFEDQSQERIPISHIGLADLTYRKAIDSFYATRINEDGTLSKVFEPLPKNEHVADFLEAYNADTIAWYKNKNGEDLSLVDYKNGLVFKSDLTKYSKTFDSNPDNISAQEYRIQTIQRTLDSAISLYSEELVNNGYVTNQEDVDKIVETESVCAQMQVNDLVNRSFQYYTQNEDSFVEQN